MSREVDARPELFWISGSPPSWRVMLAMAVKDITFWSYRLDSAKGEHKAPEFLALNPRGQVPVLRHRQVVVRESIAILAFLERQWPDRPLLGTAPAETAMIWQAVMELEINLRPSLTTIGSILFRGETTLREAELNQAVDQARAEISALERQLDNRPFLAGDAITAADCVLYPSVAWLRRALVKSARSDLGALLVDERAAIDAWAARIEAIPGFSDTYPPHWR